MRQKWKRIQFESVEEIEQIAKHEKKKNKKQKTINCNLIRNRPLILASIVWVRDWCKALK